MDRRDYFNSIADQWDEFCLRDPEKMQRLLSLAGVSEGDAVLDVGCATGVMIPLLCELVEPSGSVTAVDLSERMIDIARQRHPQCNVTYLTADIMEQDFPPGSFDDIFLYGVFPHLPDQPGGKSCSMMSAVR